MSSVEEQEIEATSETSNGRSSRAPVKRERRKIPPIIGKKVGLTKMGNEGSEDKKVINQLTSAFSHIHEIGKDPYPNNLANGLYLQATQIKDISSVDITYDLHSWIGEVAKDNNVFVQACEDKVKELQLILAGKAVTVHQEFQGKESSQFKTYFPKEIQYIAPIELKKVDFAAIAAAKAARKLYHIKGKKNARVTQCPLTHKSLNSGDVFILDADDIIYQWNGTSASRMERAKALDLTTRMRDERAAKCRVITIEEGNETPVFWEELGGKGSIASAESAGDDTEHEKKALLAIALYKFSDNGATSEVQMTQIPSDGNELDASALEATSAYVLDQNSQIFCWFGKNSSEEVKVASARHAESLAATSNRPSYTSISKFSQGAELALFKTLFGKGTWGEYVEDYGYKMKDRIATGLRQEKVNVDELHHPDKYAIAKEEIRVMIPMAGEYQGTIEIWYVKDHNKVPLPTEEYGIFYTENSYIILFAMVAPDGERKYVIYFWQGRHSSKDDQGTCALLAKEMGQSYGMSSSQIRVIQNKEPIHFLSHFKNSFVVRRGSRFTKIDYSSYYALFHVRGSEDTEPIAVEAELWYSSLNSRDSFIVVTPDHRFIWHGKGAHSRVQSFTTAFTKKLYPDFLFQFVNEGLEPSSFWDCIGGLGDYPNSKELINRKHSLRLFQCSNSKGTFRVWEINDFAQDDLDNEDVMMMDAYHEVYLWIGTKSSEIEKRMAMEVGLEFAAQAMQEGRPDTPVYVVQAGREPPEFSCHFHGWDAVKSKTWISNQVKPLQTPRVRIGQGHTDPTLLMADLNPVKKDEKPMAARFNRFSVAVTPSNSFGSNSGSRQSVALKTPIQTGSGPKTSVPMSVLNKAAEVDLSQKPENSVLRPSAYRRSLALAQPVVPSTSEQVPSEVNRHPSKDETPITTQVPAEASSSAPTPTSSESVSPQIKSPSSATTPAVASAVPKALQQRARPVSLYGGKPLKAPETTIRVTDEDIALRRTPIYDAARLRQKPTPTDIPDLTVIERHLSDEQFHEYFKVGRAVFEALPSWKKLSLKKDAGVSLCIAQFLTCLRYSNLLVQTTLL